MSRFEFPVKLEDCSLYGAGYDCTMLPFDFPEKAYRLIVVTDGFAEICVRGEYKNISAGESILVFPYESCEVKINDKNSFKYAYVCFITSSAKYSDAFARIKHETTGLFSCVLRDAHINATVKSICSELEDYDAAFSSELLSLLCSQMMVYLLRGYEIPLSYEQDSNDASIRVCSQVMNYIDNRVYSMKNLVEVASEMGYNYSYISTLFRKTCGMTLNTYFKARRMNEAKKLLQDRELSVSEIARCLNYSSVYAFSKAFKEHFGASPGHYSGRFPTKD